MPVDVSVVIPALNEADGITRQLRALDAQVFDSSWEVVVADNGSTDDTRSVVESFQSKHFLLRWIDASGCPGINHARNEGVLKSVGNRILLCDGDDEVEPGWLSALADQLLTSDAVGGTLRFVEGGSGSSGPKERGPGDYYGFLVSPSGSNCGFTRDAFDAVGGFDESFFGGCDDTDFFWRVQLGGARFLSVPEARILKTQRGGAREVFKQQYRRGIQQPHLFQVHRRSGMSRRPLRVVIGSWGYLLFDLVTLLVRPRARMRLPGLAGKCFGRLIGSARYTTLYL